VHLRLEDLAPLNLYRLTEPWAAFLKENCIVCMAAGGHSSGVRMNVDVGASEAREVVVTWSGVLTPVIEANYRDLRRRTDHGACAIALLLVPALTGYTMIAQSATGDGVDYYLIRDADDDLIFNGSARLEVSGIHRESDGNAVSDRLAEKRRRLQKIAKRSASSIADPPTYVCIVEFGTPKAAMMLT
jgi:uncharacterized protein (DUF2126 family)